MGVVPEVSPDILLVIDEQFRRRGNEYIVDMAKEMNEDNEELFQQMFKLSENASTDVLQQVKMVAAFVMLYKAIKTQIEVDSLEELLT